MSPQMYDFDKSDDVEFEPLTTVQATKPRPTPTAVEAEDDDDERTPKQTSTPVLTEKSMTKSSTPTIDSLIPTTMATLTSSSSDWAYPYPTTVSKLANSAAGDNKDLPTSIKGNDTNAPEELEKVKASLHTYKIHYRNMIIALTLFALLIVSFVAFKIWWFIQKRKKAAAVGVFKTGRRWYKSAQANKHAAPKGPGGVDMI
ncbi:hypothetical protein CERZMDRAFT_94668 [Cercospora zeae-maydis SCOH1-5]|uniref:Uncharacterized protein n=1 Tax=Cercospora zeae-maydis SCOH1-5 TaxID=717836 RepID=A0A6A6FP65_9PEZI|nr:hypothetical protein CERZMDRAFT_94668 [Cercospora zeae-maydis SCOH1-5]